MNQTPRGPAIHLFGLPTDCNSSFERGAAAGPAAIRAALWSDRGNLSSQSGLEIGRDIALIDYGDVVLCDALNADDAARDAAAIARHVAGIVDGGGIPLAVGGDHSVTWPLVTAVAAHHGPVSILHFDAHPDLYDNFGGNPRSHASPFARIMESGLAKRLVQVGIRTCTPHCRDQAQRFGVEIVAMEGFDPAMVPVLQGPLYISVDLDGIDPSEAPGVAHPEPGGLTVRELLAVIALQSAPIVGADIVECHPARDIGGVTAILAAKLVREIAARAAINGAADHDRHI